MGGADVRFLELSRKCDVFKGVERAGFCKERVCVEAVGGSEGGQRAMAEGQRGRKHCRSTEAKTAAKRRAVSADWSTAKPAWNVELLISDCRA